MTRNEFRCSSWLDAEAKKEWKRVVKELVEKEEIKAIDTKALEGYCQSYSKWKECERILQEEGYTFTTPNGYVQQRPEIAISNKALAELRAWTKELGLTPASRSRMNKNKKISNIENIDEEMDEMIQ